MSEWNKKGEECDCGSTTEHKRSPGCTVPETSAIYERGGYAATVDEVSRKWEAKVSASFASRPGGPVVGLAAILPERIEDRYPTPTPAAMLGEARALIVQAQRLIEKAGEYDRHIIATMNELYEYIDEAKAHHSAMREAEAARLRQPSTVEAKLKPASNSDAEREAWRAVVGAQLDRHRDIRETCERRVVEVAERPPEGMCTPHRMFLCPTCHANQPKAATANACWQCEAPLGTTENCLMCEAKRAEDRAKTGETLAEFVERTEGVPHPALRLLE